MFSSSRQSRSYRSQRSGNQQGDSARSQQSSEDDSSDGYDASRRWRSPLALTIHPGRSESSQSLSTVRTPSTDRLSRISSSKLSSMTSSGRSSRSSSTLRAPPIAFFRQLSLINRPPPTASSRQLALIRRAPSITSSGHRSSLSRSSSISSNLSSSISGWPNSESNMTSVTLTPATSSQMGICRHCGRTLCLHCQQEHSINSFIERSLAVPSFRGRLMYELDSESSEAFGSNRTSFRDPTSQISRSRVWGSAYPNSQARRPLLIEAGSRIGSVGPRSSSTRHARPRDDHASQDRVSRWAGSVPQAGSDETSSILPGESCTSYTDRQESRRSRSGRGSSGHSRGSSRW